MEVVQGPGDEPGRPEFYLVRRQALITGRELKRARRGVGQNNGPTILFSLNPPGAERFKRETGRSVGRRLAIILDGSVVSAPVIQGPIASEGQISGRFTVQEADDLAKILRAGALPVTVKVLQVSMPQGRSR
jgi:preprotein translocase subunit SecD